MIIRILKKLTAEPITKKTTKMLLGSIFFLVIFLEYSTPTAYIFGYLYIGAVLLASLKIGRRATFLITGISISLTLLNIWIPNLEPITNVTIANRLITVIALILSAWLSDRLRESETTIVQQRLEITNQNQLAKVREDFVSTLTHDLKTPLLGAIETLHAFEKSQFGEVNRNQLKVIRIMIHSHKMTLQIVETLMDVYRNDMEGLVLQLTPLDLTAIAEQVILQLTALASRQSKLN